MKPLEFRCFHYSLGQGNYDNWPSLWRLAPFAADCGFNKLIFYMDAAWKLASHPSLSHPKAYAVEDMARYADFAADCGMDFIPSFTTISHSRYILEVPKYRRLALGPGSDMDVLNPGVFRLFEDVFDEVLPSFRSEYVFINGDEMNLVHLHPKAKALARRRGLGALHGGALGKVARMVLKRGRRPIVWHDMLLHHPEGLAYLPKGTVIAYWFYDYQPEYPALQYFCRHGYDAIASSGQMPCWNPVLPDYYRGLRNIAGLSRAAADMARKQAMGKSGRGHCLGTMLTVWELNRWIDTTMAIYAAGQWALDPSLSMDHVLKNYGRDVFGLKQDSSMGRALCDATHQINPLVSLSRVSSKHCSPAEWRAVKRDTEVRRRSLTRAISALNKEEPCRNRDLFTRQSAMIKAMPQLPKTPPSPRCSQELMGTLLVDPANRACRVIEGQTPFGHRLVLLTNGLITVTLLPQYAAAMLEWILHKPPRPFSYVLNGYSRWAAAENRLTVDKDPGMGSPWAAGAIGGWRELIFFNSRLNPCTITGCPFSVSVVRQTTDRVTVECTGENEVARVCRTVTLFKGRTTIDIDSTATNRIGPCHMAIQPNVAHAFPDSNSAILKLVELRKGGNKSYSIWDHDGSMIFAPKSDVVRIVSPVSRHYIQLRCPRSQLCGLMSQTDAQWFTFEPYGRIKACAKGESVRLHMTYELG